jgi:hypothetical protein
MNGNESRRGHMAHQDHVLDLVVNSRNFAPAILAREEAYQQFMDEAALDRLLRLADGADRPSSLMQAVRHRLGGLLILLGTNLRGAYTVAPDIPTTSGAAASGVLPPKQQLLREPSVS